MARILALDTTTEFGGVALLDGAELARETPLHAPDGFGHILYDHLQRLLEQHAWSVDSVDCFAAAAGPGSFTGVRVGLAAVKGLGEATGKPVAAISNLRALAWFGSAARRATVLDARRGEVYGALYGADLRLILKETVQRFQEWLTSLPDGELEFLSTDFGPFRAALPGSRFEGAKVTETPRCLAGAVGWIALADLEAGQVQGAAAVNANYVRRSDAERMWRDS